MYTLWALLWLCNCGTHSTPAPGVLVSDLSTPRARHSCPPPVVLSLSLTLKSNNNCSLDSNFLRYLKMWKSLVFRMLLNPQWIPLGVAPGPFVAFTVIWRRCRLCWSLIIYLDSLLWWWKWWNTVHWKGGRGEETSLPLAMVELVYPCWPCQEIAGSNCHSTIGALSPSAAIVTQ